MKNVPRILPIVGVAVVGVLAVNAMAGAKSVPDLLSGAKAFAEGAKPDKKAEAASGQVEALLVHDAPRVIPGGDTRRRQG